MKPIEIVLEESEARYRRRSSAMEVRETALAEVRDGADEVDWRSVDEPARVAQRAASLGMTADAAALMAEPDNQMLGRRVLEQIIDANNLLDVRFLSEGARVARAVGQVRVPIPGGARLGTGFMVTSGLMMTNNHVLESANDAASALLRFDFYRRADGDTGPVIDFGLRPDWFFVTDDDLDFTIVAVADPNPAGVVVAGRGWLPLIGSSGKAIVGERVNIIQHPGGLPQQVAIHENKIVDVADDWLWYVTDTQGGSSGSPVLNDQWELAALHHAATTIGGGIRANEGARISRIVTWLQEHFSRESVAGPRDFRSELLSGARPQHVPGSPGSQEGVPIVSTDGVATWLIPVSVRIGSPGSLDTGSTSDALLGGALTAAGDGQERPYYDEDADAATVAAYYPDDIHTLAGDELFERLHELTKTSHHTSLPYAVARIDHLYPWIDLQEDTRKLRSVYSHEEFDPADVIREEMAMEAAREEAIAGFMRRGARGDHAAFLESLEAAFPFNCEHVVPQFWFQKKSTMQSDLHHLFTCEWKCNSFRGKRAYVEFGDEAVMDGCGRLGDGGFEPVHGKAAVARATLYFLLRYPGEISDSAEELPRDRLAVLLDWHATSPPDRWELHRNAEIQKVQGCRNPFIDFPEFAEAVDFGAALA